MNYLGTIGYRAAYMGHVPEGFMASFVAAWDHLKREIPGEYYFKRGLSCLPDQSANQLYHDFKGDWLLMLDNDHIFAQDAFEEMVTTFEAHALDILVGFAQKRQPPYHPAIYQTDFLEDGKVETIFPDRHEFAPIKIDSSGCYALLVRRKVFDQICDPKAFLPENDPFDKMRPDLGEDSSFFMRAKAAGFQAWCAPWIKFHHLATVPVTDDMMVVPKIPTEFMP